MRENDSLELKIIRVALPLLVYYGILLCVQTAFGIYAMIEKFINIGESDTAGYLLAYHFLDNTEEYLSHHSLVAAFIAEVLTVAVLLIVMRREFGDTVFTGYQYMGRKEILFLGFLGIFTSSGLGRLVNLFPVDNLLGSYARVSEEFAGNPMLFQILTLCIAAPVAEEIIFRGIMYRRLAEYVDQGTAVTVSAVIFGVYHGNLVQGIYALILGVLLCFAYESCKSLMAPVFLHMICNTTALIMMYFPVSGYIDGNTALKMIVMLLELAGMGFFFYQLYRLKSEVTESNTYGKEE